MITKTEGVFRTTYTSPDYKEMLNFLIINRLPTAFLHKVDDLWTVDLFGKLAGKQVEYPEEEK
jgi:hypothetical protein